MDAPPLRAATPRVWDPSSSPRLAERSGRPGPGAPPLRIGAQLDVSSCPQQGALCRLSKFYWRPLLSKRKFCDSMRVNRLRAHRGAPTEERRTIMEEVKALMLRNLVKAAVSRSIWCPGCNRSLDSRRAVLFTDSESADSFAEKQHKKLSLVLCRLCWKRQLARAIEKQGAHRTLAVIQDKIANLDCVDGGAVTDRTQWFRALERAAKKEQGAPRA